MQKQGSLEHQRNAILRKLKAKLDAELSRHLFDIIDTRSLGTEVTPTEKERLRRKVEKLATRTFRTSWRRRLSPAQRDQVVNALVDQRLGLGPLEPLLNDPSVSEIMVNGPSEIFVERQGRLERTGLRFRDREELMTVIEKALASVGRRVSEAEPYVDARLADGSRMNVAIEPVALEGPCVTIRKFFRELLSVDQLIRLGSISAQATEFLKQCVRGRLNLIISGPAASGKTTLMNALAMAIPPDERIVVVEETAELQLPQHHLTRLETKPASVEGRAEVTIRHLLRNALHMRPDRILLGEVRGEEALDMLQAMTTGHDGSMTTLHANAPLDVLDRIATWALMSRLDLSSEAVERQVRSAIDLIVHLERFGDGSRRVTHVSEVRKDHAETPLLDLFVLMSHGPEAFSLLPTGARSAFHERLARRGVDIPDHLFASPT